jgi:AcrR family transcriptional regulator
VSEPAYRRLQVDERRRQLLDRGRELFAEHTYDELSMARIAREAGISKALLYHYFPTKQAYFQAALADVAEDVARRTAPDPDASPAEALAGSLGAYLELLDENADAYRRLIESAGSVPEIRDLVDEVRRVTARRILDGLYGDEHPPKARAAVHGWLWFIDGATLDWLEHRDIPRAELHGALLGTLVGALVAAGHPPQLG